MKQEKWNELNKELDKALSSEFDSEEELTLESVFENAKLALRRYISDNKEKVTADLDEMRIKSNQNNMKQTAVEWLVEEINKLTGLSISMDEPCVEQAKAMEKEQIFIAEIETLRVIEKYGISSIEPLINELKNQIETFKSE
jgi:predicted transcriptional regulator